MSIREDIKSRLNQSSFKSLPGRCAHWAGSKTRVPDSDVLFLKKKKTCLATVHATHVPFGILSQRWEETTSNCSMKERTEILWACEHVHPCCCLRFRKQTTASFWSKKSIIRPSSHFDKPRCSASPSRHRFRDHPAGRSSRWSRSA